mgnify:CR=1 FL=1
MDMVEKVARAIAEQNGDDYEQVPLHKSDWVQKGGLFNGRFRDVSEPYRTDYEDMAEAALKAMREPTPEMLEYEIDQDDLHNTVKTDGELIWQAMIDAALPSPPSVPGE